MPNQPEYLQWEMDQGANDMPRNARRVSARRTVGPRSELNALNRGIDREDLPLAKQMQAAENLARKSRSTGENLTLSEAMSRIADAQLQKQANKRARRKRGR